MGMRFIINPIAGGHPDLGRTMNSIRRALEGSGIEFDFAVSEAAAEMRRLAAKAAEEGIETVVSVGGDGSMNEVASALIGTESALGIIPIGSGNGLARHLGIPMSVGEAVKALLKGKRKKMDYGLVDGRPFFCTMGVGFDAKVGMMYARSGHRGMATYTKMAIENWGSNRPANYKITIDGNSSEIEAEIITVANANQWGNNFHIAPHASVSDGLFDVTVVKSLRSLRTLDMPIQILGYGIDRNPEVDTFRGKSITIESSESGFFHIDGEPFEWDGEALKIQIVPEALNIIA